MRYHHRLLHTLCAVIAFSMPAMADDIRIDADYPGGNIIVTKIDGDHVHIKQDPRDTAGWWFYYNFRVRGAAGRTLTFHWMNKNPMAALGPAVSIDQGQSWTWLGKKHVHGTTFSYSFPKKTDEARFCLAMPYQLADLRRFMARHKDHPSFSTTLHATTKKQRPVHRWHVGNLKTPRHRVLIACRHHSCEMMASYALEGIVEAVLENDWFKENVEFVFVPMMDMDGVEDGDQGKNRKPHDHNRDYQGERPIYASVAANKTSVSEWSDGKLRIALDLHCPYVRGGGRNPGSNEQIYFVGSQNMHIWKNAQKLASLLETDQSGPLTFSAKHNLPWGQSWNKGKPDDTRSFGRWAETLPGIDIANTIELPYAIAGGEAVTREGYRAFGRDLAGAIEKYLRALPDTRLRDE